MTTADLIINDLAVLDLQSEEEEEIEVIYVENLSPKEIVDFARYGEMDIIEELVRSNLSLKFKSSVDERGNTPLHMAAANGHLGKYLFFNLTIKCTL